MAVKLIVFLCVIVISKGVDIGSLKLDQVLILSRHNVRTPLTDSLEKYTPKPWPKWNESAGILTQKGALLEGIMGKYISEWLDNEDLIEGCPEQKEVLIYANTKSRTIATAQAFVDSAFQNCNVTVRHLEDLTVFDPVFLPIVHNNSEIFSNQIGEEMRAKIKDLNLTESYSELAKILKIEEADICKSLYLCDLNIAQTEVVLEVGEEPNVSGPLFIGNAIVDAFIMSYYEGMPLEDVAWGQIQTPEQWELLAKISKENQNVRFNLTLGSKDIAGPLIKYMYNIFEDKSPKFTMLVGHDSNLNSVIRALEFKPFKLSEQFEPYPIGGKLMFQKWVDSTNEYLKIEYLYPSTSQLRNAEILSLSHPPKKVLLELKDCKTDSNGFCLFSDFMKLNVY
ncbi:uncharacterized protein LOC113498848 [Trichoplusia ni]|uniref:Uncharacterized protein LOC113498848 n=1 Tax=Trichoplusia ni TaxID=7111 RepID=A0A7E5W2F9_TRINI|nr:uncharacterized protein LOC113498848 [Trichoplusia ni]